MNTAFILEEYIKWIKDKTIIRSLGQKDTISVSTPFLDRHNDHIEIYIIKSANNYLLTDDGHTISDLEMSGMIINSPKREQILHSILIGFGVKVDADNALYIEATDSNIGQKKHYLLQAILAVNDMFTLSTDSVFSLFKEDVETYLRSHNILFTKELKLSGKSGFDHTVDFAIPSSINKPERLVRTINRPKKDTISASIFAFNDIKELRSEDSSFYVIYNDMANGIISRDSIAALENYNISPIPWSEKERCLKEFAL